MRTGSDDVNEVPVQMTVLDAGTVICSLQKSISKRNQFLKIKHWFLSKIDFQFSQTDFRKQSFSENHWFLKSEISFFELISDFLKSVCKNEKEINFLISRPSPYRDCNPNPNNRRWADDANLEARICGPQQEGSPKMALSESM